MLIEKLKPVADHIEHVDMGMNCWMQSEPSTFLSYVGPCDGFLDFKSLTWLRIPYKGLLGAMDPQWAHVGFPPNETLPPTLRTLAIDTPDIAVYEWLARFPSFRYALISLSKVQLNCSAWHGSRYEEFVHISYPHPVLAALSSIKVTLDVKFGWPGRLPEWDDYDLEALDA